MFVVLIPKNKKLKGAHDKVQAVNYTKKTKDST